MWVDGVINLQGAALQRACPLWCGYETQPKIAESTSELRGIFWRESKIQRITTVSTNSKKAPSGDKPEISLYPYAKTRWEYYGKLSTPLEAQ